MRHSLTPPGASTQSLSTHRRQLLGALSAGALGAWLGGCASPPTLPPRPLDGASAPRVGDTWAYHYTSIFRAQPPQMVEIRLIEVGPAGLRDRVTVASVGEEHAFGSAVVPDFEATRKSVLSILMAASSSAI